MLEAEICHLDDLKEIGLALVKFALVQFPDLKFEATDNGRFVASPDNYVTFTVHRKRTKNITVTLRGNPDEFLKFDELELKRDRTGYSVFKLEYPSQLAAAAMYIRRAAELYRGGRERTQKTPRLVEG